MCVCVCVRERERERERECLRERERERNNTCLHKCMINDVLNNFRECYGVSCGLTVPTV